MHSALSDVSLYARAPWFALDVETLCLHSDNPRDLRTVQLAAPGLPTVFFDRHAVTPLELAGFNAIMQSLKGEWYAHNAAFDYGWLKRAGCLPKGSVHCTMLAARLLTMGLPNVSVSLKSTVFRFLKRDIDKTQQKSDWSGVISPEQRRYAIDDVLTLRELVPVLQSNIIAAKLERAQEIEDACIPAVVAMRDNGLPFSVAALGRLITELEEDAQASRRLTLEHLDKGLPDDYKLPRLLDGSFDEDKKGGFNIGSPQQLRARLKEVLGFEPLDPETGRPSVSKAAVREYTADHISVYHYCNWKRYDKHKQMAEALHAAVEDDGYIRSDYMQLGADTGRFSCRTPNLQQVPRDKRFRAAAVAPPGWTFIVSDYSQLELRLIAAVSGDKVMINAFKEGLDLHTLAASAIYLEGKPTPEQRQVGKSSNFGLAYGAGARGLRIYAGSCGITMTLEDAAAIRDAWLGLYTGVAAWIQEASSAAADQRPGERSVRVPYSGHRRMLTPVTNRATVITNTPIQGAGAVVIKIALAKIQRYIDSNPDSQAKLCACIHDEIVLRVQDAHVAEYLRVLKWAMLSAEKELLGEIVPSEVTIGAGPTWADAK